LRTKRSEVSVMVLSGTTAMRNVPKTNVAKRAREDSVRGTVDYHESR
jgi:hypothetical protein